MNFQAMAIAILAAGTSALAYGKTAETMTNVAVCLEDSSTDATLDTARMMAYTMFLKADVRVVWRHFAADCRKPGVHGIVIELLNGAPQDAAQTAMARAFPYEGVRIQIFRDRVSYLNGGVNAVLLAHVMVHEITHILQGVSRHSETGIMKANWTREDFRRMQVVPLSFTANDIEMIHLGMLKRSADATANSPLTRAAAAPNAAETR